MPDNHARLDWKIQAREQAAAGKEVAADSLVVHQDLIPRVPVTTRQATLIAVDSAKPPVNLPVSVPTGALSDGNGPARGGLRVALRSSLAGGLPGVGPVFAVYQSSGLAPVATK